MPKFIKIESSSSEYDPTPMFGRFETNREEVEKMKKEGNLNRKRYFNQESWSYSSDELKRERPDEHHQPLQWFHADVPQRSSAGRKEEFARTNKKTIRRERDDYRRDSRGYPNNLMRVRPLGSRPEEHHRTLNWFYADRHSDFSRDTIRKRLLGSAKREKADYAQNLRNSPDFSGDTIRKRLLGSHKRKRNDYAQNLRKAQDFPDKMRTFGTIRKRKLGLKSIMKKTGEHCRLYGRLQKRDEEAIKKKVTFSSFVQNIPF